MAFRVRYTMLVDYVDSMGLGQSSIDQAGIAFGVTSGQTIQLFQSVNPGSLTFTATDINNIMAQVNTDLTAQLNANQARIAGFASGGG